MTDSQEMVDYILGSLDQVQLYMVNNRLDEMVSTTLSSPTEQNKIKFTYFQAFRRAVNSLSLAIEADVYGDSNTKIKDTMINSFENGLKELEKL